MRDRPAVLWLAVAVVLVAVHPVVPASRWLMVHVVVLGAVTHSIMVWSSHFALAMLKAEHPATSRPQQTRRLVLLHAGITLAVVGVPTGWWLLTLLGAVAIGVAVAWHGVALALLSRRALPTRFGVSVRYYVASAAMLPIGATLGTILTRHDLSDAWHGRLLVAHTMVNLLGWVGLAVAGTLVTLWPTMLRTRIDDRAVATARGALPVMVAGLALVFVGALGDLRWLGVTGLVTYATGWAWHAVPLVRTAARRAPAAFSTWSMAAGLVWLPVGLGLTAAALARSGSWASMEDHYGPITAVFVVGFALQVLFGALAYLLPSVLGGGPSVVRAGSRHLERFSLGRVVITNTGLAVSLAPVPSLVRIAVSILVFAALAAFLPLMMLGIRASVRARRQVAAAGAPGAVADGGAIEPSEHPTRRRLPLVQLVSGLAAVSVAAVVGVGLDPAAAGLVIGTVGSGVAATGQTTRVRVQAQHMRFSPSTISVPRGNRLVLDVVNTDPTDVHDLVFDNGARTGRLATGAHKVLDVGVIGDDLEGWCSIVGHRQMGMTLTIRASGPAPSADAGASSGGASSGHPMGHGSAAAVASPPTLDLNRAPEPGFTAYDPVLPPLSPERVHKVTLTVTEASLDVAPGVRLPRWTFNGAVPGPTLHGRVGDVFDITLVNRASMGHSIDFHASSLAPERPMRTIPPGGTLHYRFTATRSGIWMYHCSSMPMSAHIAAGLHGAVVIEPPGLAAVDRSYVLVQSEVYAAADGSAVEPDAVAAERPSAVVFNGAAFQYDQRPLAARVGKRVRIWVLDAGPTRPTSFHVVGGQFSTVYSEGAYLLRDGRGPLDVGKGAGGGGSQALALQPGQGGFVELTLPEAGRYPFVSHVMVDAERGAHGLLQVAP